MTVWNLLSQLNKALLPAIHKVPDLTRLSKFQKAIVGWKMYVTYRRLDQLEEQDQTPLKGEPLQR
ncbi:MAG: SsrA-binding protein [Bacteroidota bacterium]|nr:SsrA-binding protein [Bacteroidota bacterium]